MDGGNVEKRQKGRRSASCGFSFCPHATDCNENRSRFTSLCNEIVSRSISRLPFLYKKDAGFRSPASSIYFDSLWNSLLLSPFFSFSLDVSKGERVYRFETPASEKQAVHRNDS